MSFRDTASPHTLYARLDKLRVLIFMSAEHDVIVKTLLPNWANRTNYKPSSQDRVSATDAVVVSSSPSFLSLLILT